MGMGGTFVYKNASRFQKWSKLCGKDVREQHEEARDARIDHSSTGKRAAATPGEEFHRASEKLRGAICFLREKLDELARVPGWERLVRRVSEIRAQWGHLPHEKSEPRATYDEYLAVRRLYNDLDALIAALFEPEAAVMVALVQLKELREKYGDGKVDESEQDAENGAQGLLAICEQIKAAERGVDLILDVPAFDVHSERYLNETDDETRMSRG
jgi:hypothetical protein